MKELRAGSQLIWTYYPSLYRHKGHTAEDKNLCTCQIKP